jgi:glutathione S-transferase
MMVPYLADPNTQVEMFESADIASYLDATYGAS